MTRTVDFDAFRAEQKKEPLELLISGKTYQLPSTLPAALALDVVRLNEEMQADEDAKIEDLLRVGAAIFGGSEQFQTVLSESGVGLDELADLIKMIIEAYTGAPDPNSEAQA